MAGMQPDGALAIAAVHDGDADGADTDREHEDGEEDGEEGDGDEQNFLLFSSDNWRWPSWMPGLHLEMIRRHSVDEAATRDPVFPRT